MDNILVVNNINKNYYSLEGEIKVLNNISFKVNKNDFISIVGTSGCGKSTLLNILCGLDKEYNGNIIFNKDLCFSYMTQEDSLFPWLTVYENAILGLKIKNKVNKVNIDYVNYLIKKYNLEEFKDKKTSSLSGGMKQRVALIRTIAIKPDIILLDEPFSALDYQTRLKVSDDIYNIIKEENITAIMVTHNIEEAICLSNKVIVLSKRPSKIKNIIDIELVNKSTPINNRNCDNFKYYNNLIWSELDE